MLRALPRRFVCYLRLISNTTGVYVSICELPAPTISDASHSHNDASTLIILCMMVVWLIIENKGYEKQKQLVGVKRRGRKHHPTLPLHPAAHLPYHPTLPHTYHTPTTHLPYHSTLPLHPTTHLSHTYHTPTTHLPYHPTLPLHPTTHLSHTYHTPTTHLPKTYPTMHLPHTYPTSTTTRILNTKQ